MMNNNTNDDTMIYLLGDDRDVVYIGTTNDLTQSENEHRKNGVKFNRIVKLQTGMPAEYAKMKQNKLLDTYRGSHHGKFPKYNECLEMEKVF